MNDLLPDRVKCLRGSIPSVSTSQAVSSIQRERKNRHNNSPNCSAFRRIQPQVKIFRHYIRQQHIIDT
jgi:hypothetical protein